MPPARPSPRAAPVRLQKLLAEAGVASRRAAEGLIAEGRVAVNGVVVREPGSSAVPGQDAITVDGVPLRAAAPRTYLMLHKPSGVTATLSDPHAERTVRDLLPKRMARVYPVGRLDRESEGLLLLTDDGDLAERLLHPRYAVEREYAVLVRGNVSPGALLSLRRGTVVEGAHVAPVSVTVEPPPPPISHPPVPGTRWLRLVLREGRKREVRELCAAVHFHVIRLIRIRFGPLLLGDLPASRMRPLTAEEQEALRRMSSAPVPKRGEERAGREPGGPAPTGATRPRRAASSAGRPEGAHTRTTRGSAAPRASRPAGSPSRGGAGRRPGRPKPKGARG